MKRQQKKKGAEVRDKSIAHDHCANYTPKGCLRSDGGPCTAPKCRYYHSVVVPSKNRTDFAQSRMGKR